MCVWASRGGIALEAAAATLLLVPHSGAQAAAFVAQLLLHGGIWATLTLDEVPLINLAAGCIFATPHRRRRVLTLLLHGPTAHASHALKSSRGVAAPSTAPEAWKVCRQHSSIRRRRLAPRARLPLAAWRGDR